MKDGDERTSVHPYGREVKVLSAPNGYLSNTVLLPVSRPSVSSETPATLTKPSEKPRAASNLRTHSPKKANLDADLAGCC